MKIETKQQIITAAIAYNAQHNLSANEMARQAGINPGYLSNMLNGKFFYTAAGKEVQLTDRWFDQLAKYVGVTTNKTYWETLPTRQMHLILDSLTKAREHQTTAMIIAETGYGKTFSVDKFCNRFPLHTYRIRVSSWYKLGDIIEELGEKVNIEYGLTNGLRMGARSVKIRIDAIVRKLTDIRGNGGYPMIIFDEGENMNVEALKTLKGLYDELKDYCAVVLIGTPKLIVRMLNMNGSVKARNREAMPELYRRFKAGRKDIPRIDKAKDFKAFFERYSVEKGLGDLLATVCENYGELKDYLEPALRECDERGTPLTEQFFRIKYNMPK